MRSKSPAFEREDLVIPGLDLFARGAVGGALDSNHELDVGRPAPCRHESIGRGAAVLVREDH